MNWIARDAVKVDWTAQGHAAKVDLIVRVHGVAKNREFGFHLSTIDAAILAVVVVIVVVVVVVSEDGVVAVHLRSSSERCGCNRNRRHYKRRADVGRTAAVDA